MDKILTVIQIVISVFLVLSILLQQKGAGLGSSFGGEGGNMYSTRRGVDKVLFYATIVLAAAFLVTALARVVLS